jgi:CRISPR/Cas system Type II protein with McrA/HNH and RuvC-like nuclease domain
MEEVIIYCIEIGTKTTYKKKILWDKKDFNVIREFMNKRPGYIVKEITDLNKNLIWKP